MLICKNIYYLHKIARNNIKLLSTGTVFNQIIVNYLNLIRKNKSLFLENRINKHDSSIIKNKNIQKSLIKKKYIYLKII